MRRREKDLGIAGPRVYHWLLRSYFSRENVAAVRFDRMWSGYGSGLRERERERDYV